MAPPKWGQFAQINPWRTAGCIVGTALAALMSRLIAHFVYLWERCLKPIFPQMHMWASACRKKQKKKEAATTASFLLPDWRNSPHTDPPSSEKSIKFRPPVIDGAAFSAVAGRERFHHRSLAHGQETITDGLSDHCVHTLTAALLMIQKPDVTDFLITF